MHLDNEKIKNVLLSGGYVSEEDTAHAEAYAASHGCSLANALFALGLTRKEFLGQAMAEAYRVPYANLAVNPPSPDAIVKLPESFAREQGVIFLGEESGVASFATHDPARDGLAQALQELVGGGQIGLSFAFPEDIERLFLFYRKPLETRFAEIVSSGAKVAPEITEEILKDALDYQASDIHFEPQDDAIMVRFRIDGVLYQAGMIPTQYYDNVLNRLKVMAHLRVDEHHASQDGAIRYSSAKAPTDIRISVVPTINGEKIALRILSRHVSVSTFMDIGLSPEHQDALGQAIRKPAGMLIVSGPTGSGKTTTLYTILNTLNSPERNITTIEDPVEYKLRGINQIQVDAQAGLTFATGLRSIVRQDPNVILVGEIRDRETAEISANAALTGHLLLSTFHAIDTPSTITRLLHMDVEPTILASTIELLMTQRLVRKICESCRGSAETSRETLLPIFPRINEFFPQEQLLLFKGKGCAACSGIGYKGRTAIFEFMPMTERLRETIIERPSVLDIRKAAHAAGVRSMFEDGIEKVRNGVTTIEELLRVASPSEKVAE